MIQLWANTHGKELVISMQMLQKHKTCLACSPFVLVWILLFSCWFHSVQRPSICMLLVITMFTRFLSIHKKIRTKNETVDFVIFICLGCYHIYPCIYIYQIYQCNSMYIFFDSARRLMRCRIQASGRPQSRWLRSSKIWDPKKRKAGQEKGETSTRDLKIVFVGFDPEEFLDLNHPFPIPSATMVQDLIPHLQIWDSPQLQRTLCPGDGFSILPRFPWVFC